MNETLVTLCAMTLIIGLLKCIMAGSSVEKQFLIICGLLLTILMVNCFSKIDFTKNHDYVNQTIKESDFDALVVNKAADLVEENLCNALNSRYNYVCEAEVCLLYDNNSCVIDCVKIKGSNEKGYIRSFISDYLCLDERSIYFD